MKNCNENNINDVVFEKKVVYGGYLSCHSLVAIITH